MHHKLTVLFLLCSFSCFGDNITNLWKGQALYQGMPLTTVPFVSAGGYTPVGPTNWTLYYIADTATNGNGTLVDTWRDTAPAGSNFHLTASGAARPYWTNNASVANGKGYLVFDGTSDYMKTNFSSTIPQTNTIFWVAQVLNTNTIAAFFSSATNDVVNRVFFSLASPRVDAGSGGSSVGGIVSTDWTIWCVQLASTRTKGFTNGVAWFVNANAGGNGLHGFEIGARYDNAFFINMNVAFWGMFNGPITDTAIANVFSDLNNMFHIY